MKLLEGWGLKSQEGKEIIKLIKLFSEKKRIQPQKTKITQISRYVFFSHFSYQQTSLLDGTFGIMKNKYKEWLSYPRNL